MNKKRSFIMMICVAAGVAFSLPFFLEYPLNVEQAGPDPVEEKGDRPMMDARLSNPYTDDLQGLLEKKIIRVLTTLNRTNFFISDGHLVGYEYSILKDYEDFLNHSTGKKDLRMNLEFIPVSRDELIPRLLQGYGDIAAAGLTITDARKKKAAFTVPYLTGVDEIVVTSQGVKDLETLSDLSGRKVYIRKSSSYFESLKKLNHTLIKDKRKPVEIQLLGEDLETESILEMVNSGALGITVSDSHIAKAWSMVLTQIRRHETLTLSENSEIAWMVRKENPKLKKSLDRFLKTHKKGTELGNIYFKRYFEYSDKLENPTNPENWQKLKKYKSVIQRYSRQYDFNWLLILAMAFQESGLDHSQTSDAGAVGLMQVLPSTAKDRQVNIADIQNVENNVHAGVKYLAFLRDRYYSQGMEPRDQIRMSLAAYNAGPSKIRKARALAEEMGLDKNKWFRNVEIATLRIVGQETVRYVSNINKYYNLYRAIVAQDSSEKQL